MARPRPPRRSRGRRPPLLLGAVAFAILIVVGTIVAATRQSGPTATRADIQTGVPTPSAPEPTSVSPPPLPPVGSYGSASATSQFLSALGNLRGAVFDEARGRLTVLADSNLPLRQVPASDWAAVVNSAYSGRGPAFSLDPADPHNPSGPVLRCVYYGPLRNTVLGLAMFDADWAMKLMGVGKITPPVAGFKNLFDLSFEDGSKANSGNTYMRFWVTCGGLETRAVENCFLIDNVRMVVKTERMYESRSGLQSSGGEEDPRATQFARFLTDHYDEIAGTVPAFGQVKRMATIAALAYWLRDHHAIVDHSWLAANASGGVVTPEKKPARAVSKERSHSETKDTGNGARTSVVTEKITLFGGVDLAAPSPQPNGDPEAERVRAFVQSRERCDGVQLPQTSNVMAVTAPMFGIDYAKQVRRPDRAPEGREVPKLIWTASTG